jgi:predicted amidohydrolase
MISEAADKGAQLVMLPEIFYHPYELKKISKLEEKNRETVNKLRKVSKQNKVYLCTGSTVENEAGKRVNKSFLIDPHGKIILEYSKMHLFDVNFKGLRSRESLVFNPGNSINVADTKLGKIGIIICYDIRFPELTRSLALRGAEIILVPATFNIISGEAHWDIFSRCRAVENQVFLAAACPARDTKSQYVAYGHSRIIDPWGTVIAEAGTKEEIIFADITNERLDEVRKRLPLLQHLRKDIYKKILSY